jgi:CheY-like chemotaxis protein
MDHVLQDTMEHMADGKEKDEIIEQLLMCKTNCAFMSVAINRTVDFAKSTSDIALTPKMEPVSITDSMQWAVTCLKAFQPNVSIAVVPLPAGICDMIVTDKHWLMENVLCYLSNAVKYSASGHVTVSASFSDYINDSSTCSDKDCTCISNNNKNNNNNPDDKISWSRKTVTFRPSSVVHPEIGSALTRMISYRAGSSGSSGEEDEGYARTLRITVEDEGIGISDDKKSSLFKPFQQTMRLAGGTGLGLYSLSKRVEVLKGSFGVEDRADGRPGSRFWFSIPYYPNEDVNVSVRISDSSRITDNGSTSRFTSPVVALKPNSSSSTCDDTSLPEALVVEDSIVVSKSTKRMLERAGYKVDVAENGAIGLEKMKAKVYSIVIMDLQMPVMDGLEAARRIRLFEGKKEYQASGKRQQYIIGASANGADDVMKEAMDSGMDMFMEKPFSMSILAQCQQDAILNVV